MTTMLDPELVHKDIHYFHQMCVLIEVMMCVCVCERGPKAQGPTCALM